MGGVYLWEESTCAGVTCLALKRTEDEAQQLVGQQAGGDEGQPQKHVQLLGQFRMNPHQQAAGHR